MTNHSEPPTKKKKPHNRKLSDVGRTSISENRKLAQASRTLKACDLCRKQKTRCFRSPENPLSCLRCTFLNKPCSFETTPDTIPTIPEPNGGDPTLKKLDLIYSGINEVLRILKHGDAASALRKSGQESIPHHDHNSDQANFEDHPTFQSPTNSLKASPFSIVTNQVSSHEIPTPILNLLDLSTIQTYRKHEDLITLSILTEQETIELTSNFRRNYGRWVLFPKNVDTRELVERIRFKSPLLLTTCCCLSLRFSLNGLDPDDVNTVSRKRNTYRQLGKQLVKEVNQSLLKYTSLKGENDGDIEFLQSLVILSIYSFSLTSIMNGVGNRSLEQDNQEHGVLSDDGHENNLDNINLDPWFLSSVGLTTFLSKSTFGKLFQKMNVGDKNLSQSILLDNSDSNEYQTLTILRIYNHLCLVHLSNCVFSGRMCVIDEIRLNYCTSTLGLSSSTNFDGRMISEIGILLITYNFIQLNLNNSGSEGCYISLEDCESNFEGVREELRAWYDQWEYLFDQAPLQFVELNYDFCNLVIYYSYNYQKSLLVTTGHTISQLDERASLYDENHIDFIFGFSDKDSLVKMIQHAYNVVRFVNVIESDSYFAYLSDQVHFCFYFSGICLIKLLRFVVETKQTGLLAKIDHMEISDSLDGPVGDIKVLIHKFKSVGQGNEGDVITKYERGLTRGLEDLERTGS
ncbi:uncharacterized protein CANTADRAFT_339225 [Suhomyces tanzawaensis NRRL Y-17324]|uniref:Zn(2)-C6 fungal-type domain-containing protein n=1 Tax=Suhomyces tanzawaensis NRRL Y-17324 TaxID=984487 RepID=A0A1E4SP16_9ASCO|nr:uncharacterized protein CANTADRAFT_339225 [Suhomyces tanzawaensis NRRL Y-17324]ODV81261.1 hypothetical protein CANTADRAFT_339225 [Suhomyces tanzawaensis NRRL Y-17324]